MYHCFRLFVSFANFILVIFVALATELAAATKMISNEKAARLAADQSLAEERAARQTVD
jgi:hypothetical protein